MTIRSLNGLSGNTNNVYVNTNLSATLPLEENQSSFNNPITISLKGLNGLGTAGQVIRMNSGATALEYGDDEGSNWTVNGSNIYPTGIAQVIVNTTSNTNNRNLLINGTGDIVGNLYFGNNNDIYIKAQGQNMRNYAGHDSGTGASHLFLIKQSNGVATEVGSIKTGSITNIGNANISSGNSKLLLLTGGEQTVEIINNNGGGVGGSPYLSFECQNDNSGQGTSDYYIKWVLEGNEKMRLTTSGLSNVSWLGNTISELYGGTGNSTYSTGDILYSSASNTLSKLSIGSTDQVLTVKAGIPSWEDTATPDLTTATNFGTAVQTGTIKMGNSSGNSYTANIELYVSSKLSIFNTSNVEVAKFEPATNTCDLSLFGGVLSNATIGSNTQYLGTAITYNYGGTGLSSLSGQAGKILQVNSSANGYDLINLPNSSLWTSSAGTLSVSSSYTKLDLDTNITYNLLNTDVRVKPTSLSEGQLISYDSGLGGGNGSMIFGSNSTSASSGWDTGIYAKQFIKLKCASTEIAEFSVSPASVKTIKLLGDIDALSVRATTGDTVIDYTVNSFSDDVVFNIKEPNTPRQFKIRTNPYDPVYEMTHISSIGTVSPIFKYYLPGGTETINLTPIVKFEGQYLLNNSNDVIYWPLSAGTLALNVNTARLGSFGSFGCVYDPTNVTTPSASNSAFIFATNGTVTRMNCRVDGGTSNHGFDFAGNNVFRFDSNGTINVRNSGQSMYAFNTPNTSGTLALIDQVQEKQSYIRLGDAGSGSNTYGLICDPNYTINYPNAYLKYHTNGTDLRLNCRSTGSSAIHMDYGNSNTFSFTSSGELRAKNSGQAQYTHTFQNTSGQISTTTSGGYSIQGNDSYGVRIYTKGFIFNPSTTTTLWDSASIKLYWDGTYKQPRFDIKITDWWDIAIDHITGTSGSTNPLRTTTTNDSTSSGSGIFFSSSTSINSAFNITNYGTFVRGCVMRESLDTSKPALFFDYSNGASGCLYLTLRVLGANLTN